MINLGKSALQKYLLKYAKLNSLDRAYIMNGASTIDLQSDVSSLAYHDKDFRNVLLKDQNLDKSSKNYIKTNTNSKKLLGLLISFIIFVCMIVYSVIKYPTSLAFSVSTPVASVNLWESAGIYVFYMLATIAITCIALWLISLISSRIQSKAGRIWTRVILLIVFVVLVAFGLSILA